MNAQQQAQQPSMIRGNKKRLKRRLIIAAVIILALVASTITIFSLVGVIPGIWATIISAVLTIFSLAFGVLPLVPADDKPAVASPPGTNPLPYAVPRIHIDKLEVHSPAPFIEPIRPAPSSSTDKSTSTFRGIVGIPPPSDSRTIQQREQTVRDIYNKLTQPGFSALVLAGIGGLGKSTLAALVYRYVDAQQLAENNTFTAPPLWLRVDPAVTLVDILSNLCAALNAPTPDLSTLTPPNQAVALINVLNTAGKGRLMVLDQFENVLDNEGCALPDRPGIGEWLDALNSQPCACRVLLTSRPDPQGTHKYPQTYLRIYHVEGLNEAEGIELLHKWSVQGSEAEMCMAIQRCKGHALSLTLLASLLQKRNLSLATLLKDPQYTQLWMGDIAQELLDAIYEELDLLERRLLAGFSAYREPVPPDAANAVIENSTRVSTPQVQAAIGALLAQHLLDARGEGCYQPHAIVAEYVRCHLVEGNEQANRQTMLEAQSKAAQYYLERSKTSCPPRENRRKVSDVHDLIEAIWQYCQAEQWMEAYEVMQAEGIFDEIKRWGGNAVLLELYQLLLPPDKWKAELAQAAHIYSDLGWIYSDLGQKKLAQEYYELALSNYRTIDDRWGEGNALFNLGLIDNTLGKKDESLQYFGQALSAHREVGNRRGEGRTLSMIGRIYGDSGKLALALDHYEQALAILRQVEDEDWEARVLHNLGMAYYALGQKDAALDYYERALAMDRKLADRGEEGKVLNSIGLYYNGLGQPEKALEYLEEALSIHSEIGNKQWESVILNNVGTIYLSLLQDENALRSFGWALRIEKEVGNRVDEGVTLGNIGTLFFKKNRYRAAFACFLLAQNIFQEVKMAHRSITSWIAAINDKLGDEQFIALKSDVEPQAQQIVDQALREGI